jgi:hypothetical protein
MARIDAEPEVECELCSPVEFFQLKLPLFSKRICVGAGMELHKFHP